MLYCRLVITWLVLWLGRSQIAGPVAKRPPEFDPSLNDLFKDILVVPPVDFSMGNSLGKLFIIRPIAAPPDESGQCCRSHQPAG